jgi:hypothetical protein
LFGGAGLPAEEPPDDPRPMPWTLKSVYRAEPGSLTPLRFGSGYRFRLKGVDLAGNPMASQPPADASKITLGDGERAFRYLRYDAVPHPVVLVTSPIDHARHPAESLRRLVLTRPVRHFEDEGVERCIIPPPATFRMAEQHGMFDGDAAGSRINPDHETGFDDIRLLPECDACGNNSWKFVETADHDPLYEPPRGKRNHGPYWPDPMAESLCIRIEDLVGGEFIEVEPHSFYGSAAWPKARGIMLRVQPRKDGSARVRYAWLRGPETLVIYLPPSWVARISISSGLPTDRAEHMAHFSAWKTLLLGADTPADQCAPHALKKHDAVRHAVICGCHPMISPCEELILVHPVEKPLRAPVIDEVRVAGRAAGDVTATLDVDLHMDRKSTGRLALNASWKEFEDRPLLPTWRATDAAAHVDEWALPSPEKANDFDPVGLSADNRTITHRFHDTKYREVRYTLRGTSRFKDDFAGRDDGTRFTTDSDEKVVTIPSSAPPKVPEVLYVKPTFNWSRETERLQLEPGARVHSKRGGGGLRVYLARGWFSSGGGERLGVVLWPSMSEAQCERLNAGRDVAFDARAKFPERGEKLGDYVTRWGLDPLWEHDSRKPLPFMPTPHHFKAVKGQQIVYGCKLRLQECEAIGDCDRAATDVTVVGYEPQFDAERGVWYCDIRIHPVPSYYTFVHLALVRYQPNSIAGAEISRVTFADFAQLVPDRSVSVTRVPFDDRTVHVQVFGIRNEGNFFDFAVERACGDLDGDFIWMKDDCIKAEKVRGSFDALESVHMQFPKGCGPRRIVVREYEHHLADADAHAPSCFEPPESERDPGARPRTVSRVVYADVVTI